MESTMESVPEVLRNLTWLDFDPTKNCSIAGKLFGGIYAKLYESGDGMAGQSIYWTLLFARESTPVPLDNVTGAEFLLWDSLVTLNNKSEGLIGLSDTTQTKCYREFCRNIEWAGNPDLAGIGVISANFIQAIITTLFCLGYLYFALVHQRYPGQPSPSSMTLLPSERSLADRLWHSLEGSITVFWISSVYFGLSVAAAVVASIVIDDRTEYTVIFGGLAAVFTASVLLAMWPLHRKTARYPLLGDGVLVVILLLLLVISAVYVQLRSTWNSGFELYCFSNIDAKNRAMPIIFFALTGVPFTLIVWPAARLVYRRKAPLKGYWAKDKAMNKVLITLSMVVVMWVTLGFIVRIRFEVGDLVGDEYTENEWGFGQILALMAWLPTVVDVVCIWIWDYERALSLKLPAFLGLVRQEIVRGKAVQSSPPAAAAGMATTTTSGGAGSAVPGLAVPGTSPAATLTP